MGGKRGGGAKGAAAAVSAHSDSLSLSPPLRIRSPPPPPRRGGPAADQATGQDLRPQDRVYSTTNSGLSLYIQIYGPLPVLARRAAAALRALSRRWLSVLLVLQALVLSQVLAVVQEEEEELMCVVGLAVQCE